VRLQVLGLGPIDYSFFGVPPVDMQPSDLLDPLAGQYDDLHGTRIGRVNRRIRAFEPAILHELILAELAGALDFGFGRNAGRWIVGDAEAARGSVAIIVLGLHSPAIGRMDVAPDMIRHRPSTALIDRPDQPDDLFGFDLPRQAIAAERVSDLVEPFFSLLPGRLGGGCQRSDIALEQIGDRTGASVRNDLDAVAFLADVGEVALEDLAGQSKRHRRIGAEFPLGALSIS